MNEHCDDCDTIFSDRETFLYHKEKLKYCEQYKNILFTCNKCLYYTKGIKNIDSHILLCDSSNDQISSLKKRVCELDNALKNLTSLSKTQLSVERVKNKIYRNLIDQNTKIQIDNIVSEKEDGIHVYNGNSLIPIHIHELIKGEEVEVVVDENINKNLKQCNISPSKQVVSAKKQTKKSRSRSRTRDNTNDPSENKKQSYRSIKSCMSLVAECSANDRVIKNDLIDSINKKILDEFGNLEEANKSFQETFDTLKQSRIYTKILNDLAKKRMSIFGRMSLSNYQNLVCDQIRTIEDIFCQKNYTDKKSITIISKGLTPLESRLIFYGNYTQTHIEIDEIQKLDTVLDLEKQFPKEYVPYDSIKFFNCFYNYGLVLFTFKKNLERYLFNRYELFNVIYLPLPKNTDDDPYSFFVLDKVNKEKRYWKMDCRLEDLTTSLIANVLPYMISMFKKLYRDVFGDNDFRSDFKNKCQLTEYDCEQLVQNIILLAQPKEFCIVLRLIVKKKATYIPTENDKFNLYGDDALQRKRFHDKEDVDLVDIIKQLFDVISSEQAVDFYRSRTNLK
jgi:hypothetical protein